MKGKYAKFIYFKIRQQMDQHQNSLEKYVKEKKPLTGMCKSTYRLLVSNYYQTDDCGVVSMLVLTPKIQKILWFVLILFIY